MNKDPIIGPLLDGLAKANRADRYWQDQFRDFGFHTHGCARDSSIDCRQMKCDCGWIHICQVLGVQKSGLSAGEAALSSHPSPEYKQLLALGRAALGISRHNRVPGHWHTCECPVCGAGDNLSPALKQYLLEGGWE